MNDEIIQLFKNNLNINIGESYDLKPIGGLSNTNFKLSYSNEIYFIRICNNSLPIINRPNELDILAKASQINLCPSPLYFDKSTGNMISPWIYGSMPTEDESNSKKVISKLILNLKDLHKLSCNNIFNPFDEIRNRVSLCRNYNLPLPNFTEVLLNQLAVLENDLCKSQLIGLCHNDLNPSNIIISKDNLFLIDYELSGMGDVFFDLATIAWLASEKARKTILKEYFGYFDINDYNKLIKYIYVVKMLSATWSLLKSLDNKSSYDYINGSSIIFRELLEFQLKVKN